jgi:hypothetical protein
MCCISLLRGLRGTELIFLTRQKELNDRGSLAVALRASNPQVSTMSVNDVLAYPKAEPGSHRTLCRVKGFENPSKYLGGYATARIRHSQQNSSFTSAPVLRFSGAKQEAASPGSRVNRIPDEVTEHLPYVSFEHLDWLLRPVSSFHDHSRVLNLSFQKREHSVPKVRGTSWLRCGILFAKPKCLIRNDGYSTQLPVSLIEVLVHLRQAR